MDTDKADGPRPRLGLGKSKKAAESEAAIAALNKDVLDLLAAGVGEPEILRDFPYLQAEDIRACLE